MLWDLIRDFFVQHVFGGTLSDGSTFYSTGLGNVFDTNGTYFITTGETMFPIGQVYVDGGEGASTLYVSFADWLSTTATAIAITIIVVLCCMFVYKIVKLIGGLIR